MDADWRHFAGGVGCNVRYQRDWAVAIGRSRSCLAIEISSGNRGPPEDVRIDAASRLRAARDALDGAETSPLASGHKPSQVVLWFAAEDLGVAAITRRIGILDTRKVKRALLRYIATLAAHYAKIDEVSGRSRTAHTKELALRQIDPEP